MTINIPNSASTSCVHFVWCYQVFILAMYVIAVTSQSIGTSQLLGIKYISYDNFDGTLATGECCDEPGTKAGSCTPDMCDTTFSLCLTSAGSDTACDILPHQKLAATYDKNTFSFGKWIGNGAQKSPSFFAINFPFTKGNLNVTIDILEVPEEGKTGGAEDIAEFNVTVDWLDPVFRSHPKFRRHILNDTHVRLVVDIISQCRKHFYTHDCSVYCKPDGKHYECLDNGTIHCLPGWSGSTCLTMINYCPGNLCQHSSTCVPILLNYTCTCAPGFTGTYCETKTASDTISNQTPSSQASSTSIEPESADKAQSKDSINTAVAAGVPVGILALLAVIVGVVYFVMKRKERAKVIPGEESPFKEEDLVPKTPTLSEVTPELKEEIEIRKREQDDGTEVLRTGLKEEKDPKQSEKTNDAEVSD